ncbi:MAG: hypothetical protein M1115_10905 [Actinobacteria bacterium]|nr:hypothetical protein [Actinomycetota bacterium]
MDPVLERAAMTDEVEAPASPLTSPAHLWARKPDRRHKIKPGKLGGYLRVDPVYLAGKSCKALHLLRIRDLDRPAQKLEGATWYLWPPSRGWFR